MRTQIVKENGLEYRLAKDGMYYPVLELPESTNFDIGKYGIMRCEYLQTHKREQYIRLFVSGKLNEHLHEVDEECNDMVSRLIEQMKPGAGVTEELKLTDPIQWIGLMNDVKNAAEEIVLKEKVFY